jgi:hypothetical protein
MLTLEDSKSLVQEENLKAKPKVSNEEEEEEENDESREPDFDAIDNLFQ